MTIATRLRGSASQRRRALVVSLAAGPLVAPRRAAAQAPGKVARIGWLSATSASVQAQYIRAFNDGLRELGWVEGTNILIEQRFAENDLARLPALATELVKLKVDLIVTGSNDVIKAAKDATSTIPIVTAIGIRLVELGWIQSLRRPGGNLTGLAWDQAVEIATKIPDLLREAVPRLARMGGIIDPAIHGIEAYRSDIEKAAQKLGVNMHHEEIRTVDDIEGAFAKIASRGAQAVFVYGSNLIFANLARVVALAARNRLADMYIWKQAVALGGLMSYAASIEDMYRRAPRYVDRILKGANPAEMAIEQPTKYEFALNLKTARTLGLTVPQSLLVRADELIE